MAKVGVGFRDTGPLHMRLESQGQGPNAPPAAALESVDWKRLWFSRFEPGFVKEIFLGIHAGLDYLAQEIALYDWDSNVVRDDPWIQGLNVATLLLEHVSSKDPLYQDPLVYHISKNLSNYITWSFLRNDKIRGDSFWKEHVAKYGDDLEGPDMWIEAFTILKNVVEARLNELGWKIEIDGKTMTKRVYDAKTGETIYLLPY